MAAEKIDREKALAAFDKIESVLASKDLTTSGVPDLCALYKQVKGIITTILPIVELIPLYGKQIADLIRLLEKLADMACP